MFPSIAKPGAVAAKATFVLHSEDAGHPRDSWCWHCCTHHSVGQSWSTEQACPSSDQNLGKEEKPQSSPILNFL